MKCPLCKGHFDSNQDRWRKGRKLKGLCQRCNKPVRLSRMNKNGKRHNFKHCDNCLAVIRVRHRKYRRELKFQRLLRAN